MSRKISNDNADWNRRNQMLKRQREELLGPSVRRDELNVEILPDAVDQVCQNTERDIAADRLSRQSRLLHEVDLALEKIDGHMYGICEDCDAPIPARRLDAIPWARRCVACQTELESRAIEAAA